MTDERRKYPDNIQDRLDRAYLKMAGATTPKARRAALDEMARIKSEYLVTHNNNRPTTE